MPVAYEADIYDNLYESTKANNFSQPVWETLILDLPPQITTQPVGQAVTTGSSVALGVSAVGTPPLHYQWQFNNADLPNATSATLNLANVQLANTGNYTVIVTNPFGATTSQVARVLVANPITSCAPPPSGMIGWWPGNGNAKDIIGGNDGVTQGTMSFVAGEVAQAFHFDGTSYVQVPDSSFWAFGTNDFSIELWASFASVGGTTALAAYDAGGGGQNKWIFWVSGGQLQLLIYNTSIGEANLGSGNFNPAVNQWYHLAVTREGSVFTLYVNGAMNSSATNGITIAAAGVPLTIGEAEGNYYLNGSEDEVSVYNRALSGDEIATLYLAGAHGKCPDVSPTILIQPADQSLPAGSSAVFSVSALGEQPLTYQWSRNGVDLADSGRISGSGGAELTLNNVSAADAGLYSVIITNAFGTITSTGAVLTVALLLNGGFETGDFRGWNPPDSSSYITVVTGSAYANSGTYGVEAGPSGSLAFLTRTVPTLSGQSYALSFWLDCQGGTPNEFLVAWNGNTLFDETNVPPIGRTNMQFVITATGPVTPIEFGFRNDPNYFGLDDISLATLYTPAIPPPRLTVVGYSLTSGFQLNLHGQTGQAYTLQGSTNLVNWDSLTTITAGSMPTPIADPNARNFHRRFYRVKVGGP